MMTFLSFLEGKRTSIMAQVIVELSLIKRKSRNCPFANLFIL